MGFLNDVIMVILNLLFSIMSIFKPFIMFDYQDVFLAFV